MSHNPMVSCVLLAHGRRRLVGIAIEYFLRQDYEPRELIIVDDGTQAVEQIIPTDERIQYIRLKEVKSTGAKRNLACEKANGEIIMHWDDDTWYAPHRIRTMVETLLREDADLCGLSDVLFYDPISAQGRLFRRFTYRDFWAHGSSLCYRRAYWQKHRFADMDSGAEDRFVSGAPSAHMPASPDFRCQLVIGLENEMVRTLPGDVRWEVFPAEEVRCILGDDRHFYESEITRIAQFLESQLERSRRTSIVTHRKYQANPVHRSSGKLRVGQPLVSCIMPTNNRPQFTPLAIGQFLRQDYEFRELIIVDDGIEPVESLVPRNERIRYFRLDSKTSVGAKRNIACEQARGEIIIHWDDDDWHAPHRIRCQVMELQREGADLCGFDPLTVLDLGSGLAWSYRCPIHEGYWASGGSLCYRRALWQHNRFPEVDLGEDRQFLWNASDARMIRVSGVDVLVAMVHRNNIVLRKPGGTTCWSTRDSADVIRVMGDDYTCYQKAFGSRQPKESAGPVHEAHGTAGIQYIRPPMPPPPLCQAEENSRPKVSCIMPTLNRRRFVPLAVQYFLRQDYEPKELLIIDDGSDSIEDLIPEDNRFRYIRLKGKMTLGAKRNLACELARGELILHWDDDDWQAPHRISTLVRFLLREDAELCGLNPILFYDIRSGLGWLYRYPPEDRFWVAGTSFCYKRRFWERNRFPDIDVGKDNQFVWNDQSARMFAVPDSTLQVAILHDQNGSQKATNTAFWYAHPADEIRRLLGPDLDFYPFESRQTQLNLGCGDSHVPGMWNVDISSPADQIVDLRCGWPWADSSVDSILARDVIEHLPDKIHTMNEAWRVLRPGGRMEIAVPTTDGPGAFQDPTHQSYWNRRSFLYFEAGNTHRERFATRYGISAAFRIVSEAMEPTENGPQLTIVLEAVK